MISQFTSGGHVGAENGAGHKSSVLTAVPSAERRQPRIAGERRQRHRLPAAGGVFLLVPTGPGGSGAPRREVVDVGFADKFTNKLQKLRGRMKRNAGAVSGDRRLEAEGSSEEVRGGLKQAGEKVRDAFRGRGGPRPRY